MSWLERIFRRRRLYDELTEEMREHLDEKTEQRLQKREAARSGSGPGLNRFLRTLNLPSAG